MWKILVGLLLVISSPARSGLFIEMSGIATRNLVLDDYSLKPLYRSVATLSGYCGPLWCEFQGNNTGFSVHASMYHSYGLDVHATYLVPPADPFDGQWRGVVGNGIVTSGYWAPGYELFSVDWSSARLFSDDEPAIDEIPSFSSRGQFAIPEPATWLMILSGFGIVGAGWRRRAGRSRIDSPAIAGAPGRPGRAGFAQGRPGLAWFLPL